MRARRARHSRNFCYTQKFGAVPKWPKGEVCKTSIRGFESHPRLHRYNYYYGVLGPFPRCASGRLLLLYSLLLLNVPLLQLCRLLLVMLLHALFCSVVGPDRRHPHPFASFSVSDTVLPAR